MYKKIFTINQYEKQLNIGTYKDAGYCIEIIDDEVDDSISIDLSTNDMRLLYERLKEDFSDSDYRC